MRSIGRQEVQETVNGVQVETCRMSSSSSTSCTSRIWTKRQGVQDGTEVLDIQQGGRMCERYRVQ